MYPGTIFQIEDQSIIPSLTIQETTNKPILMMGITSDKGPEEFKYVSGKDFFTMYGSDISFARHGQPLLQAANAINSGGELFVKRIVAEDSKLANIGVIAHTSQTSTQKKNSNGELLYTDKTTSTETTVADGNTPVMINTCTISYSTISITDAANDMEALAKKFKENNSAEEHSFPLFIIADVGRGVSKKKFRIAPDYNISRTTKVCKYVLSVIESNDVIEEMTFSMNPDFIENDANAFISNIIKQNSKQIRCVAFEDKVKAFLADIATIASLDADDLLYQDILFGKTKRGVGLNNVALNTEVTLDTVFGLPLASGSNGTFGDSPITVGAAYTAQMVKVFNGEADDNIYNLDNNPIDLVVDANYPDEVKRAIETLVDFRDDVFYFRDMGTSAKTISEFKIIDMLNSKTRNAATYEPFYDIIDPYTKKQITVTAGYSLVRLLINHLINGRNRAFAGKLYDVTIPEMVEGTVNFVPKITPSANQKTDMEDLNINYGSYFDGIFTLETEYTSQTSRTQLSFINNVLSIQEIIKAVRKRCPKVRYSFIDGKDLAKYQEDINAELTKYSGNFKSLTMEYVADSVYAANKIYYAVIKVSFRDFVQTEIFKLIALPS